MSAKIVEVNPGVYEIFLPLPARPTIINVYLFDCHGAWTLIDTGMNLPDSVQTLEEVLATVGIKIEDLDVLIGTHHHPDHFGASAEIQRRSGAKVYLHQLEQEKAVRVINMATMGQRPPEAQHFFRDTDFRKPITSNSGRLSTATAPTGPRCRSISLSRTAM